MGWFERIKRFYDNGLWNIQMVRDAVNYNKISPEQFAEITGEVF